ncbi:(2,3-dihydroxybenzoyl)adenylate synthase [Corticimicrobacter populi]|uniref:(2,3-dihydroxybenzoyl)adenylate synthase n=1 Tax=Corticimicrobacter populi TaxID=2175229 RepID=A0A2V1JYB5_9BURK|nr:(2,3-dihydroxybenzoyl)adenylate synthase [Corticimicrobacter populi]PWF23884.1 (2,3-dihydroxybenzoyl)adenylate synthase [Corticimicrobacter populi]
MIPVSQVWPEELARLYRQKGYWRGETFGSMLRERAQAHPERIALVEGETRWSYAELDRRADLLAAGFLAEGLKPGDRVIVHLPNVLAFFPVVFGLFRAGILPVYALPAHRITEIEHFARSSEAVGYVIADHQDGFDYRELATELCQRVPAVAHVFVAGEAGPFRALDDVSRAGETAPAPATGPQPSDVAFMQISGGSTGLSKLIPRTHDDYIYTLRASAEICGLDGDNVFLVVLPMAHNYPMSSPGVLGALYAGSRIVLCPSPSPEVAFPLIERERADMVSLVPPLLLVWLDAAEQTTHDLSSLKVMQVGGAKLIPEVARRVRPLLGVQLQQVFGMAEGLVNYTRLDDDDETMIGTQGRPISPDDEIRLVDDQDRDVPAGEPGNLLTRGPYTIRGYHNNPTANARSFTEDGFYRTGDIVRLTERGYLVVQGRAGDHINRGGEKISAEEVEDHLLAHPGVFDAAVVSMPDEYLGERSCAFIIARGEKPRAVDLKRWIRERGLAAFKVPDQIVFVDKFAATAAGKISRKELRASLRAMLAEQEQEKQGG